MAQAAKEDKEKTVKIFNRIYNAGIVLILLMAFICVARIMYIMDLNVRYSLTDAFELFFTAPSGVKFSGWLAGIYAATTTIILALRSATKAEQEFKKRDNRDTVNGDAHFQSKEELKEFLRKYAEDDDRKNMILSENVRISFKNKRAQINSNVLMIAGAGGGKSWLFGHPNFMQFNVNMIVNDPSAELRDAFYVPYKNMGYNVKILNLRNLEDSSHYNPFQYIFKEEDILTFAETVIKNTTPPGSSTGEAFWTQGETMLLEAMVAYMWHVFPKKEQTFNKLLQLLESLSVDDNKNGTSLDHLFADIEKEDPENLAVRLYKSLQSTPSKIISSFLISLTTKLQKFKLKAVSDLTSYDELDLMNFANEKNIIFVILPTADNTFNFLAALLYTQMFEVLYNYCDKYCGLGKNFVVDGDVVFTRGASDKEEQKAALKEFTDLQKAINKEGLIIHKNKEKRVYEIYTKETRKYLGFRGTKTLAKEYIHNLKTKTEIVDSDRTLPRHVRLFQDEAANTGQIPDFTARLSTCRKYNISVDIILQSLSQLKKLYPDEWGTILSNCDTKLFYGCDDVETLEYFSTVLDEETTKVENRQIGAMHQQSISINPGKKALRSVGELSRLDKKYCIVRVKGEFPILDKKYNPLKHPNKKFVDSCERYVPSKPINAVVPLRERTQLKSMDELNKKKEEKDLARKKIEEINALGQYGERVSQDVDSEILSENVEQMTDTVIDAFNSKPLTTKTPIKEHSTSIKENTVPKETDSIMPTESTTTELLEVPDDDEITYSHT